MILEFKKSKTLSVRMRHTTTWIDDEPINENLEYILQEVTENNNDFGIQKIRDFIENRKVYGDFD